LKPKIGRARDALQFAILSRPAHPPPTPGDCNQLPKKVEMLADMETKGPASRHSFPLGAASRCNSLINGQIVAALPEKAFFCSQFNRG